MPSNLDPVQVTAWATIGLFLVGALGFVASTTLAIITGVLARHTRHAAEAAVESVRLQKRDQELRAAELKAADARREADLDRAASAEIVLGDLGGEHTSGGLTDSPTNLTVNMVVTNKGPGYARGVAFGVSLGTYGFTMRDDIGAMAPGDAMHGSAVIEDAALHGMRGNPLGAFSRWLTFEDVLARRWKLNQGPDDKVARKERI